MGWLKMLWSWIVALPQKISRRRVAVWWSENVYTDALTEFVTVFFLSNLPFLALVLIHYLTTAKAVVSFETSVNVIRDNWKPGEIFILVSALLAPFPFLLGSYHRMRRHIPAYVPLFIVLLAMFAIASVIFALDRLKVNKNEAFVEASSLFLYALALFFSYFGLVFQRNLKPPKDNSNDRADKIAAQLQQVEP